MIAQDEESMDKAKEQIEGECEKNKIALHEGTGPDYEKKVHKIIHKDRVR